MTTQQIIDVGPLPNDGQGDPLRQAFQITNDNFSNIWASGPVGSQVVIANNVISTSETNLDLILQGNGIGTVTLDSTTVPGIDAVYDLGSPTQRFNSIYGQYFYGNGAFLTGITGLGATVTFDTIPPVSANIGDIWIQSNTAVQYLYFSDGSSNQWAEMEAYQTFSSLGNATGNVDLTYVQSDIIPSATNSYSLGNSTRQWQDLYVSNGSIYMNGVAITSDGANLTYNGNTILTTSSALTYANLTVTGNVVANKAIANAIYTDNYYYANGAPFPQGSNSLPGTTIQIKDNVISTTVANQNLVLKANGIGILQTDTSIVPSVDDAYDLGSSAKNFDTVYTSYVVGNGATFTSNVTAQGNVSGTYILGNGYFLTGVGNASGNADLTNVQSNILPAANVYSIGNVANQWQSLWVKDTINLNSVPLTMVGTTLRVNGTNVLTTGGSPTFAAVSVTGNTVANAVYTDNYFYANGAPFPQGSNSVPGTTISLKDNVISTTVTNQNLILKGNGIGNVQANSSIMPSVDEAYDIGSPTYRFDTVYAGYFVGNGAGLTGISGGGNSNKIVNGNSYANIATADGNVVIAANGNTWTFGINGTTSFPSNFINPGNSQPLGIYTPSGGNAYTQVNQNYSSWEVYPEDDNTAEHAAWAWIRAELPTTETPRVFIQNVKGSDGIGYTWNFDADGVLSVPGNITGADYVTANYFVGDGSGLSNISIFGNFISDGTSKVDVVDLDGNVVITANTVNQWTFDTVGNLTAPANAIIKPLSDDLTLDASSGNVYVKSKGHTFLFDANGVGRFVMPDNGKIAANSNLSINVGDWANSAGNIWTFNTNGTTLFPNNTINPGNNQSLTIRTPSSGNAYTQMNQNSNHWEAYAEDDTTGPDSAWAWIYAELPTIDTPRVFIENKRGSDGVSSTWTFDADGNLTLPQGSIISDTGNVGIGLTIKNPPTIMVISGADFAAVNLTYTRDFGQATPTWYPPGYTPGSDPYILFDNNGWGIWSPGFGQALYVNTGSIYVPLTQWNINPPLGSVAPTGVYTSYYPAWAFGTDGVLTLPALSGQIGRSGYTNGIDLYNNNGGTGYVRMNYADESIVWADPSGSHIQTTGGTWDFDTSGNLTLAAASNTQQQVQGTTQTILGDPFPVSVSGNSSVTVWTADSDAVGAAKMTMRAQYGGSGNPTVNIEIMDIAMAKTYPDGTPVFTVSNRIKTNPAYADTLVNVVLATGNVMQVTSSAPDATGTVYWTYSVTAFDQTLD